MSKIIIDFFMYIFEATLLWYYGNSVFISKYSKSVCYISSILIHILLGLIYQLGIVYLNAILLVTLYCAFFVILYQNKISSSIFHAVIFIIVMFASEILVMGIGSFFYSDFNAMDKELSAYIYVIISSKILYFIIIMAIMKIAQKNKSENQNDKYFWALFILPFSSILMILSFRYMAYDTVLSTEMNTMWIVSSILVLFSNIVVFIIYEYSQKNAAELYDLKAANIQEEQDKKYYDLIESSNNEMRGFAHDIKNHLIQISNIEKPEEVRLYIDSLVNEVDKFSYTGISKNKMLDLIISKYIRICERKSIKFEVDTKTSNLTYINDVDLSTLMNNLLDNAIESAAKSKGGFVQLRIFSRNAQFDGIIIRNTCIQEPKEVNGKLQTTKRNKKLHGLGISNINRIIKKYNAVYDWKYDSDNNVFETDIALKKQ